MLKFCPIRHYSAWKALLALALLLQQVTATVALKGIFARACLPDTFLRAAVGLHLRHGGRSITREKAVAKGK
jgi:hypothetical protein